MGRKRTAFPDLCHDEWINIENFHTKYDIDTATGCWDFVRGARHQLGYRFIGGRDAATGKRKMLTAHRVSWRIHRGPITQPNINHTCHNRACVNPDHLYEGTQRENMRDMWSAGRGPVYRPNQRPRPHRGKPQGRRNLTGPGQPNRIYKYSEEEIRLNRTQSLDEIQARYPGMTRHHACVLRHRHRTGYPWIK